MFVNESSNMRILFRDPCPYRSYPADISRYDRAYSVNVDVVPKILLTLSCVTSAGWEKSSDVPNTPAAAY